MSLKPGKKGIPSVLSYDTQTNTAQRVDTQGSSFLAVRVQLKAALEDMTAERNTSTDVKHLSMTESEQTAVWTHSPGEKVASSPILHPPASAWSCSRGRERSMFLFAVGTHNQGHTCLKTFFWIIG